ncbi:hypothetical protein C0992_010935 [Termitomyces sp. T32_za158]|nr:hypothetical protein C0992_010935 [Termitomyces sp. T32_za158]
MIENFFEPSSPSQHLNAQHPARATVAEKIRQAILASAMVDALGGPTEFRKRFTFPLVVDMIPNDNFLLPPGVWTDDTSMTLCLAHSLATFTPLGRSGSHGSEKGGFDEGDQLRMYAAWYKHGTLSAIDHCFDIGGTMITALDIYCASRDQDIEAVLRDIRDRLSTSWSSGNGSLMRVLPIGLAYWRDENLAREYARRSSRTTHPNNMCQEACEVWTQVITQIMRASTTNEEPIYSKLDVVKTFAEFPYTDDKLRKALAFPTSPRTSEEEQGIHSFNHHPLLRLIAKTQSAMIPQENDIPSSGYVLDSLVAALYCFLATDSFEEGAIMAINLGDDADTVGAIYAGLAGCWYAGTMNDTHRFWTERVITWRSALVRRDLVESVAEELVQFSVRLASTTTR